MRGFWGFSTRILRQRCVLALVPTSHRRELQVFFACKHRESRLRASRTTFLDQIQNMQDTMHLHSRPDKLFELVTPSSFIIASLFDALLQTTPHTYNSISVPKYDSFVNAHVIYDAKFSITPCMAFASAMLVCLPPKQYQWIK
jgi:hypothetical protein